MIFLEDQIIEDIEKEDTPTPVTRNYIDVESEPPSKASVDRGDVQVDGRNIGDEPTPHPEVPIEQVPPEPTVEPQLRRYTRECYASQRYSPHEYVMITNSGKP